MQTDIQSIGDGVTDNVLVIGAGPCARRICEAMQALRIPVMAISREASPDTPRGVEVLEQAEVTACRGGIGDFTLTIRKDGERIQTRAGAVVIAEKQETCPAHDLYRLSPDSNVRSLSELINGDIAEAAGSAEGAAVFLHGLARESHPDAAGKVMNTAMTLARDHGLKTYVLTGNLKAAGNGLEKLYRKAREAGVVFAKFTRQTPDIQASGKGVEVSFIDEVTHRRFALKAGLAVVDDLPGPSPAHADLLSAFRLQGDSAGFLQADNVHRLTVETNRKGILAAGPARGVPGDSAQLADADAAVAALLTIFKGAVPEPGNKAEIIRNQCVRCLTCYRVCTYRAVHIDSARRPRVISAACAGCGVCATECPREAIRFEPFGPSEIAGRIEQAVPEKGEAPFTVVFLCSRSAAQAREQAIENGWTPPPGLYMIEVPCAGTVSVKHLMSAFHAGAGGVLVLSCHPDNCHSDQGTIYAARKVSELKDIFGRIGQNTGRIASATLAANMGAGFMRMIDEFQKRIAALGGSH